MTSEEQSEGPLAAFVRAYAPANIEDQDPEKLAERLSDSTGLDEDDCCQLLAELLAAAFDEAGSPVTCSAEIQLSPVDTQRCEMRANHPGPHTAATVDLPEYLLPLRWRVGAEDGRLTRYAIITARDE